MCAAYDLSFFLSFLGNRYNRISHVKVNRVQVVQSERYLFDELGGGAVRGARLG